MIVESDISLSKIYEELGYHVFEQLITGDLIDALNSAYEAAIRPYPYPLIRQSAHWEYHEFDENGSIKNPLLNPHLNPAPGLAEFTRALLDVCCSEAILKALQAVGEQSRWNMMQTMLFEQSATPPHQDWYYLDSVPEGRVNAAWIALEDIHPDATRFFVVPKSVDMVELLPKELIADRQHYHQVMWDTINSCYGGHYEIPSLKKGDVLIWNSRLIHGSIQGENKNRTRLSITAHYLPDRFGFGNRYRQFSGPMFMKVPHKAMNYAMQTFFTSQLAEDAAARMAGFKTMYA